MSDPSDQQPETVLDESSQPGALSLLEPAKEKLAEKLASETGLDQQKVQQAVALAFGMRYEGPIPPAREVAAYNNIEAGLGTRLVEDHLDQRKHEREIDLVQVELARRDATRADRQINLARGGTIAAFVLLFALFLAAFYLALNRHPELAAVFLAAPLVGVIGVILGQAREKKSGGKE